MSLTRNQFATHFFREISGLNYAYLNCTHADVGNLPLEHEVTLLIDKEDYASLLYVITSFTNIRSIRTKKEACTQYIQLHFADQSRFSIKLLVAVRRYGQMILDAAQVLAASEMTNEGVRLPCSHHRFEYFFLRTIFAKKDMPADYTQALAALTENERSRIFGHLVSKYRFVIHVLDDLFAYQRKHRIKACRIVKTQKTNRRVFRMGRTVAYLYYKFINAVTGGWKQIDLQPDGNNSTHPLGNHIRAFLLKKAAV